MKGSVPLGSADVVGVAVPLVVAGCGADDGAALGVLLLGVPLLGALLLGADVVLLDGGEVLGGGAWLVLVFASGSVYC